MSSTQTKERPIIFSGPMVRAILDGRKTQTRRLIKPQPTQPLAGHVIYSMDRSQSNKWRFAENDDHGGEYFRCPYGLPGDRLWVRETFVHLRANHYHEHGSRERKIASVKRGLIINGVEYRECCDDEADQHRKELGYSWTSSIYMPRWASRITLEVVSVRVERLRDITDEEAIKEGYAPGRDNAGHSPRDQFGLLWDTLNGRGSFHSNPWVWAIEFKRVKT